MRFYTCSLFRIRNVEIISKWGSIPAVSQQCILLESAVVVDAEHQFRIRGHVKAVISTCYLFMKTDFFFEWHEGWNIIWISCKVKSLRQNIFRLCAEIQSYAWSEAKFCNSQKSGLHNNCFMRILYKSDVHWAIYIWWESSELTILMSQDLSRIKVSWFGRDVVCDQPCLTKTPSKG